MVQFLVKRLIGLLFVVICVTFITFIFGFLAPGDPIRLMLGQHPDPLLYQRLKHDYGLDLPWYQQYFNYFTHLLRFDFGLSYHYPGQSVSTIISGGLTASTELGAWGLLLTILLGIPVGVVSALKANTWIDTLLMGSALILYAIPVFVLAVYSQVIIVWLHQTVGLNWPVANWGIPWHYTWEDIQFKLIPIVVYAAAGFAGLARFARTSMLEVLRQDYVRTARAKGLPENIVVYRHALRNALIPLVTIIGLSIGLLVTGVFFIEQIFNIPGVGFLALQAVRDLDYPVIQATAVLGAIAVVAGNFISDILYTIVDPRIKAE